MVLTSSTALLLLIAVFKYSHFALFLPRKHLASLLSLLAACCLLAAMSPLVITVGNTSPLVITVQNTFPLVITVGNTLPLVITVCWEHVPATYKCREKYGSSFFLKNVAHLKSHLWTTAQSYWFYRKYLKFWCSYETNWKLYL